MSKKDFCCDQMRNAVEDPDIPLVYIAKFDEYGINILDGGTSYIKLQNCPWSGDRLPPSLREKWFDELEKIGIDPAIDDVPSEFKDERWYTAAES